MSDSSLNGWVPVYSDSENEVRRWYELLRKNNPDTSYRIINVVRYTGWEGKET